MARITNILGLVQRAGKAAEVMAKKQLEKRRATNKRKMNTFGLLSDSISFRLIAEGFLAKLTLESFDEGKILDDGFSDIPFRGRGKGAKFSFYIDQLAVWAAKKFYSGNYELGLRAAFAIAKRQEKYKSAPKNPGWMKEIKEEIDKEINIILTADTISAIDTDIMTVLNKSIP